VLDVFAGQASWRGRTHVWREDDRGWREVQLRDIEGLIEKVCGIELVERDGSGLSGSRLGWLGSGAGAELHARHARGDAGHAGGGAGSSTRIVRFGSLVSSGASDGNAGLGRAVCRSATICRYSLGILGWVAPITGRQRLWSSKLASYGRLSSHSSNVSSLSDFKGLCGICPLLLASVVCSRGAGC